MVTETISSLVKLTQASRMLAEIRSVDDAVKLINLAEAARVYAKQIKLGLEAQNDAAEIKIRAQRRAGEILLKMEKNKGTQGQLDGRDISGASRLQAPEDEPPTYADLGIAYKDAHVWQTLASMEAPLFDQFLSEKREAIEEITTAAIYREAKRFIAKEKDDAPPLPTGKYRVIYADPPWNYGDKLIDGYGAAEFHYPSKSTDELCVMPVKDCAEDNAVLFIWITSPLLSECFGVIEAWGFEYKASFVWDKVRHNYGHYNSVRHEFLLICTRGSYLPECADLADSVIELERDNVHSHKPEQFRELIDHMYPSGKALELFQRGAVPGGRWKVWGNESG